MPRQEFEYFTKPFVSVKRLPSNGGVTSWPCEVSNIAQQVPACLPAPTLQGLERFLEDHRIVKPERDRPLTLMSEELTSGQPLEYAMYLVLWLYKQHWEREHGCSDTCSSWNSSAFKFLLQEVIGCFMQSCHVQEQVEYAVPRGQSERLNVFPGLSKTCQAAPFIVLYHAQNFENAFSWPAHGYSNEPAALSQPQITPSRTSLMKEESGLNTPVSDVRSIDPHAIIADDVNVVHKEPLYVESCNLNAKGTRTSSFASVSSREDSLTSSLDSNSVRRTSGFSSPVSDESLPKRVENHRHDVEQPQKFDLGSRGSAKETYLLTEAPAGEVPGVAVLCAGLMDELITLMLSAIYQRSIWKIREPLVGFCWDTSRAVVTTVFGWMDEDFDNDGRLPNVHIVYADEGPSNGVFDLRSSESVLRLVLFLWNIRETIDRTTRRLESTAPDLGRSITGHNLMQWRADTTPTSLNEERITREELFSLWANYTKSKEDDSSPELRAETSPEGSHEEFPIGSLSSSEGDARQRHLTRSHSYFEEDDGDMTTPLDQRWLQDRYAHSIRLPSDEEPSSSSSSRHDIIKTFKRYTQFHQPPNYSNDSTDLTLLVEIRRFCKIPSDVHTLNDDVWEHIVPHLGMISLLSASAQRKVEYKTKHQLAHSEIRTEWETLMGILFHASSSSIYCLRAGTSELNLPRNAVSDLLPSMFDDWEIYARKFTTYSAFIQAQKLEWTKHWERLLELRTPQEITEKTKHRVQMLGGRVALFLSDGNKRHLWRSLQRDPLNGGDTYMGVVSLEVLPPDASSYDLPTDLLSTQDSGGAPPRTDWLKVPLLCYGYSQRPAAHPRRIPQTSMNHARMNLVAAVTYLTNLGVVEFPLFGVAIEGSIGTVLCAWCGPLDVRAGVQKCICVLDQDTVEYDLTTRMGAYNYATFLSFLAKEHAPELAQRLGKATAGGSELAGKAWVDIGLPRKDWTMAEQVSWFKEHEYLDDFDCQGI